MPYVKQEQREVLGEPYAAPQNAGELNYMITTLLINYWADKGHSYQTINDIIGACGGACHEFQRRVVGKYEDQKIKENGDVYT